MRFQMANSSYTESLAPYGTSHSGSTLSADLTAAFRHNIVPIQAVGSPVKDQNTMNTYFRNGLGKSPVFCNISSIIPCPWGKMRGRQNKMPLTAFLLKRPPSPVRIPRPIHYTCCFSTTEAGILRTRQAFLEQISS